MNKINVWLTKNKAGNVEIWKSHPEYDAEMDEWMGSGSEVGSEIYDKLLDNFVNKLECVKIEITKI